MTTDHDPVRARRALIGRWAEIGQRTGYAVLGLAVAVFGAGALWGFTGAIVNAVVAALAVGSLLLAPAIVVGYGVKAAERDDRGPGRRGRR